MVMVMREHIVVMIMGNTCCDGHEGTRVVMVVGNTCCDGREGTRVVMVVGNTSCVSVYPSICVFKLMNCCTDFE